MAPRSKSAPPPPETRDALAQAVTELTGHVETLKDTIGDLNQRMAVLTAAIDDIRQEFEYAVRNDRIGRSREQWRPVDITSVPKASMAPDLDERVNRNSSKNPPNEAPPADQAPEPPSALPDEQATAPRQRDLF